ncbi:MAG: hypothetical protein ACYDA3_01300 [Gaiellaceae bacterium]
MRRALLWIAGPLCVGTAFLTAWIFELSTESVLVLMPVIVVCTAAAVGLLVLWAKMFGETVLRRAPK